MRNFDELDAKAKEIMSWVETKLCYGAIKFGVSYVSPRHEVARRFLNEINEFKPSKAEEKRYGKNNKARELPEDLERSKRIIERLLDHISVEAMHTMELRCRLLLAGKEGKGENDDDAQRKDADTQK